MPSLVKSRPAKWINAFGLVFALTLISMAFLRTAWVSEDAYITFRSIDNLLSGFGLRWNVDERVMVFTHPLWLMLLTPFAYLLRDDYTAALVLSYILTLLTTWILCKKVAKTTWGCVFVGIALASSYSFVSFSSSGLEGPLLHLLIACAIWKLSAGSRDSHADGLFWGLVLAFSWLTRPDSLFIFFPIAAYGSWSALHYDVKRFLAGIIKGLAPAMVWVIFATLYFGSPLPNTFFAKVVSGVTESDNIRQGLWYLYATALNDPAGTALITGALVMGLFSPGWARPLAVSILAHCTYIVWVGGDYMAGRFTTPLVILSAGSLLAHEQTKKWFITALPATSIAFAAGMFILGKAPIVMSSDYSDRTSVHSVYDERGMEYALVGLLGNKRRNGVAPQEFGQGANTLKTFMENSPSSAAGQMIIGTVVRCSVGKYGKGVGSRIHIIDPLGLTDPFLSHLPGKWANPGHIARPLPYGYASAVAFGDSTTLNPHLAQLWKDVQLSARSDNWFSAERLAAIWRLNTGEGLRAAKESGYTSMLEIIPYWPYEDCASPDSSPDDTHPLLGYNLIDKNSAEVAALIAQDSAFGATIIDRIETQLSRKLYREASETANNIKELEARNIALKLIQANYAVHIKTLSTGKPQEAMALLWDLGLMLKQSLPAKARNWNPTLRGILLSCQNMLATEWKFLAEQFPDDESIHYNAGLWMLSVPLKYREEAVIHLLKAANSNRLAENLRGTAFKRLGLALINSGRVAQAEAPLRSALEQSPPDMQAYCLLSEVYRLTRRFDEAARADADCPKLPPSDETMQ